MEVILDRFDEVVDERVLDLAMPVGGTGVEDDEAREDREVECSEPEVPAAETQGKESQEMENREEEGQEDEREGPVFQEEDDQAKEDQGGVVVPNTSGDGDNEIDSVHEARPRPETSVPEQKGLKDVQMDTEKQEEGKRRPCCCVQ